MTREPALRPSLSRLRHATRLLVVAGLTLGPGGCAGGGALSKQPGPAGDPGSSQPAAQQAALPLPKKEAPSPAQPAVDPLVPTRSLRLAAAQDLLPGFPDFFSRAEVKKKILSIADPERTVIALDHHRPRTADGRRLRLSDLLNEDEELAPGTHHLVVVTFSSDSPLSSVGPTFSQETEPGLAAVASSSAQLVRVARYAFSVETVSSAAVVGPGCWLLFPYGTYNGQAASSAPEVLALAFDAQGSLSLSGAYSYQVRGENFRAKGSFPAGQVAAAMDVPSGDLLFEANCGSGFMPDESSRRTVTVNREGPSVEKPD